MQEFDETRQVPGIDAVNIEEIMAQGPSVPKSEVVPSIPAMPAQVQAQVQAPSPPPEQEVAMSPQSPKEGEGPKDDFKKDFLLPTEQEKARLRQQFGELRVVPIPYNRADGKVQCYVLRQLTRQHWRSMEDSSRELAEKKGGNADALEIFQEKIVAHAVVWPDFEEHHIKLSPAGLAPTLFGVVQQMGLFFDPDKIMSITFPL